LAAGQKCNAPLFENIALNGADHSHNRKGREYAGDTYSLSCPRRSPSKSNDRYWPIAPFAATQHVSHFQGKADLNRAGEPKPDV
jgi:hypothetical protein